MNNTDILITGVVLSEGNDEKQLFMRLLSVSICAGILAGNQNINLLVNRLNISLKSSYMGSVVPRIPGRNRPCLIASLQRYLNGNFLHKMG